MLPLQLANRLVNLSPRSKEARIVDAFTGNLRARRKMVSLLKSLGYGKDANGKFLPDESPEWLLILLKAMKFILPLLLALI